MALETAMQLRKRILSAAQVNSFAPPKSSPNSTNSGSPATPFPLLLWDELRELYG